MVATTDFVVTLHECTLAAVEVKSFQSEAQRKIARQPRSPAMLQLKASMLVLGLTKGFLFLCDWVRCDDGTDDFFNPQAIEVNMTIEELLAAHYPKKLEERYLDVLLDYSTTIYGLFVR